MDEQKLTELLNEQSLINMSIIEQLNQQAGYLHSIVERLELISNMLSQTQPRSGEFSSVPIRSFSDVNVPKEPQKVAPPIEPVKETKEDEKEEIESERVKINTKNAKAILFDESMIRKVNTDDEEDKEPKEETQDDSKEEAEVSVEELIPQSSNDPNQLFMFGDRIRVITDNIDDTGVFIELDDDYLVWVKANNNDPNATVNGQITFTNIKGASIIRLS